MIDHVEEVIRQAVAEHLGVEVTIIRSLDRFADDLALQPLDIVLVALRIEDVEHIELPIDRLDRVETVADLATLVRRTHAGQRYLDRPSFVPFRRRAQRSKRRSLWRRLQVA